MVRALDVMSGQVRSFGPPKSFKAVIYIGRIWGPDVEFTITPLGQAEVLKGVDGRGGNFTSTA